MVFICIKKDEIASWPAVNDYEQEKQAANGFILLTTPADIRKGVEDG